MEGETSPVIELDVSHEEGLTESHALETVTHCTFNDLQSYLTNFNKEIEVNNDGGISLQNVLSKVSSNTRPMFVSLPVSSDSTSPDEEQLPVIVDKVDKPLSVDGSLGRPLSALSDGDTTSDHMIYVEIAPKDSPVALSLETGESKQSSSGFSDQSVDIEGESQLVGLGTGQVQLQELDLDQNVTQFGLQTAASADGGVVMLPVGDINSILSNADPRFLQIVTVNGQPTLQLVGATSLLPQQTESTATGSEYISSIPASVIVSNSNTTILPTAVDNANSALLSQLQTSQTIDSAGSQVLAVAGTNDEAGSQIMTLDLETDLTNATSLASVVKKEDTGFQSVAILPSGDAGNQQQEVGYVLIVNPTADDKSAQGQILDFGNNIQGEIVDELMGDNGITKRLVKISNLQPKAQEVVLNTEVDDLTCNLCDYTSQQRYLMKRNIKSHNTDRPHRCALCDRGFKSSSSLRNHINIHTGVRPHKCKFCESAFTTSGELVRHIRYKHTFEKPHKCTECEYASVELSKLKRHMRSHTGERPFACQYCNYASPDTYKLKRHMRIHTGEKPYQCEICGAKFTQSNSLKSHKLIHSGNKPVFQCSMCPATCGRNSDLKVHMQKLHSAIDQPLVCKKCNAKFPDRYSFKLHIKSHDGEKGFKCTECEFATTTQRALDAHVSSHIGVKGYECKDCDLTFRQKQLLKRHMYIYHNPLCNISVRKTQGCPVCERNCIPKEQQVEVEDPNKSYDDKNSNMHSCGGVPGVQADVTPLTAEQLIENSLLADMKDGKLGTSPKVVVVHPDGRVEEVTAKLQSLSQSKPMDDFLVSLGVSGESHFDQVSSLPGDVHVPEVTNLMTVADTGVLTEMEADKEDEEVDDDDDENKGFVTIIPTQLTTDDVTGFNGSNNFIKTYEAITQVDSDDDVDVETYKQDSIESSENLIVEVLADGEQIDDRLKRRASEDLEDEIDSKQVKLSYEAN